MCEKTFSETDLFILNPNEEELQLNEKKMKARKEAALAKVIACRVYFWL
jgi:hypothetical protein